MANDAVFKVPEIPRKSRKLSISTDFVEFDGVAEPDEPVANGPHQIGGKEQHVNQIRSDNGPISTEISALCQTFMAENMPSWAKCIQSSLEGTLHKFYRTTSNPQQFEELQQQVATMRSTYDKRVEELKQENDNLKQEVNRLTNQVSAQSSGAQAMVCENGKLKEMLGASKASVTTLSSKLNASSIK